MISKKYRLSEREVKKVLRIGKPFFSYGIVLNYSKNRLPYNRFAIVIGAKSVNHNITRNFFRRRFYDIVAEKLELSAGYDLIFVVKKQTKLDKNNKEILNTFTKDIGFLLSKILK